MKLPALGFGAPAFSLVEELSEAFAKRGETLTPPAALMKAQRAMSLGVNAADRSLPELVRLRAEDDRD